MRTNSTSDCTGMTFKRGYSKSPFLLTVLCITLLSLLLSIQAYAQKTPPPPPSSPTDCKIGCTSNDVRILDAYLVDPNTLQRLDNSFQCQGNATVKLALELATNTPRVGVAVYAKIKDFTGGTVGTTVYGTPSECFGVALNQPSNKVVFGGSFSWPCGKPIVLTDVFLGWGTGNTNFCTSSAFQCPGTSSKCYSLPPGQYITIQIPTGQSASQTKCSSEPEGTTATFDLTQSEATIKNGQSNVTVKWYSDAAGTTELTGTSKTAFVNTTTPQTVYAKVCNNADLSVCSSLQPVTLTVKPTPAAPVLSKVDNCNGTTTITAKTSGGETIAAGELTWSNGATTNPITVNNTTAVTATRTLDGCTSGNSNSITPAPKTTPAAPAFTVTQPSLCGPATGTITICQSSSGYSYKVGDVTKSGDGNSLSFTGLAAGSNPTLVVTLINPTGDNCPSEPFTCDDASPSCGQVTSTQRRISETVVSEQEALKVTAYPNPFGDRINFVITSPESGKGSLEVYNVLGQKVKTVFQGNIAKGAQNFSMQLSTRQQANLIYILRVGDKQISGKILQMNQ